MHGRYVEGERSGFPEDSGGPELSINRQRDRLDYRDTSFSMQYSSSDVNASSSQWRYNLETSHYRHRSSFNSPGIFPGFEVPPNGADTRFTRNKLTGLSLIHI